MHSYTLRIIFKEILSKELALKNKERNSQTKLTA